MIASIPVIVIIPLTFFPKSGTSISWIFSKVASTGASSVTVTFYSIIFAS